MKSKNTSNQTSAKKKNLCFRKRRAVADVISTMLLMGITVTGASTLTYFMNDAFVSGNLGTVSTLDSSSLNVLLLAYDTRDSFSLLTLNNVDNENIINSFLCGVTCSIVPNAIPVNGGTEFIVMQIQNNGLDPLYLEDVVINSVTHSWDSSTAGVQLDASSDYLGSTNRKYPSDGMFSILPVGSSPIIQNNSIQINSGETVNILVKLGSDDSDIQLNRGLRVLLNVGELQPVEFVIESGDAR